MKPVTLVVGKNSFIARCLAAMPGRPDCRFIGHHQVGDERVYEGIDRILNCALDPAWRQVDCPPEHDLDLRLGRAAAGRGLRYVMLSSRKVYDPRIQVGADEDAALGPCEAYGRNKLATELALRALLGDRLLVLRVANVIGWEYEPGRGTLMGTMLRGLAERERITLDVSPFVERDFLPVEDFVWLLAAVLRHDLQGTYNVGSGASVPIGRLALWLVEGFGRGEVMVVSPREVDAFRLETSRLRRALGEEWRSLQPLDAYCRRLGARLRATLPDVAAN